jgi:hypothetical protein
MNAKENKKAGFEARFRNADKDFDRSETDKRETT